MAEPVVSSQGLSARKILIWIAIILAVLEVLDSFTIEVPIPAIVYAILLAVGAWWLTKNAGKAPVIYTGLLCLIQLLLTLFVFGGIEAMTNPGSAGEFLNFAVFILVSLAGTIAAGMALRSH
jgi:hypothetical protein